MSTDQSAPKTIDAYIAVFPPEVQALLEQIRRTIGEAAPDAQETISYGMPTFTLNGRYLVYFAAYKKLIGLVPCATRRCQFDEAVSRYGVGKGILKFPLDQLLPLDLIRNVVQFRIKENVERAAAKGKKK